MQTVPTRRQEHGIKSRQITLTLSAAQMERIRREAGERSISISRHVAALVETAWAVRDHLNFLPRDDDNEVA